MRFDRRISQGHTHYTDLTFQLEARMVCRSPLLRQGGALLFFGRASSADGIRAATSVLEPRIASAWQRAASGSAIDHANATTGARQMHYNTASNRNVNKASESDHAHLSTATARHNNHLSRQQAVEQSRLAGGGLTWAEQFMLKRKRLQESP